MLICRRPSDRSPGANVQLELRETLLRARPASASVANANANAGRGLPASAAWFLVPGSPAAEPAAPGPSSAASGVGSCSAFPRPSSTCLTRSARERSPPPAGPAMALPVPAKKGRSYTTGSTTASPSARRAAEEVKIQFPDMVEFQAGVQALRPGSHDLIDS